MRNHAALEACNELSVTTNAMHSLADTSRELIRATSKLCNY